MSGGVSGARIGFNHAFLSANTAACQAATYAVDRAAEYDSYRRRMQ